MLKHEHVAVEDMAEYWINRILDRFDESFNDQDIV